MNTNNDLPNQEIEEPFLGIFTQLDIQDVYHQIPNEIKRRLSEENPSIGIGGGGWNELLDRGNTSTNRGPMAFFPQLLEFLNRDVEFVKILFEKSKTYTEDNYYRGKNFSKVYAEYLNSIWNIINHGIRTEDQYKANFVNRFGVDYHYFYSRSLEILVDHKRQLEKLAVELDINFEGDFSVKKNTLVKDELVLDIKTRRKPGVGKYLSVKNLRLWLNLNEVPEQANFYEFISAGRYFSLHVENDSAQIKLIREAEGGSKIFEPKDKNALGEIIIKMIYEYIPNFKLITDRNGQIYGWENPPINGFLWKAIDYCFDIRNTKLARQLIELANSIPQTWRTIKFEEYEDDLNGDDE